LDDVRIHDLRHNSGNRIIPATDGQQLAFSGESRGRGDMIGGIITGHREGQEMICRR
jgi:hypothetical protein